MPKVLIISNQLVMGGAEKLVFEMVSFALQHHLEPTVLILDNYNEEHYDAVFRDMHVKVVRTRLKGIRHFRAPRKMIYSFYWLIRLKFFAEHLYNSIHVIGLYNVDKVAGLIFHKSRHFWHVNNAIQFPNRTYPYHQAIFSNPDDTIVCINNYQLEELNKQFGKGNIRSKIKLFKLFISGHDSI